MNKVITKELLKELGLEYNQTFTLPLVVNKTFYFTEDNSLTSDNVCLPKEIYEILGRLVSLGKEAEIEIYPQRSKLMEAFNIDFYEEFNLYWTSDKTRVITNHPKTYYFSKYCEVEEVETRVVDDNVLLGLANNTYQLKKLRLGRL